LLFRLLEILYKVSKKKERDDIVWHDNTEKVLMTSISEAFFNALPKSRQSSVSEILQWKAACQKNGSKFFFPGEMEIFNWGVSRT
jgi:hypothetical protein